MGIRDYLTDPDKRRAISGAIRRAFDRRRQGGEAVGRIMVVDDDPLTRETLVRSLERAGYQVCAVGNGKLALQAYAREPVDLVITDIFMPECDGLETIAGLRRRSPEVKIVAVSSRPGHEGYLKAAKAFGAVECLIRPFDSQQLLDIVDELMRG